MFTVKLVLDKRSKSKKGYPVKIELYDKKTKTQKHRSTGYFQDREKLRSSPELTRLLHNYQDRVDYCNKHRLLLQEALVVFENGYDGDDEKEIAFLRERLLKLEKRQRIDFEDFVQQIIEERELKGGSVRHFKEAVAQIQNFVGDISLDINEISYEFLKRFEAYKRRTSKGNGSGIKKTVRTLRTVYNEAKRRGKIHDLTVDPFDGLDIKVERVQISEQWKLADIKKLFDFVPKESTSKASQANMERVIDIFLFQIAIGGHDLADVANLKWKDIKTGRIKFQRFKLRSHSSRIWVDNFLSDFAIQVIEKHGTPKVERVFSFYADPRLDKYRKQNGYQLKTLNRITKTLGIPKIGTKSPRYIFRSLGGQLGINELLINQLMAHKPGNVSNRYQQDLSFQAQDDAHRQILKMLF